MIKEVVLELEGRVGATYPRYSAFQVRKTIQEKIGELTESDIWGDENPEPFKCTGKHLAWRLTQQILFPFSEQNFPFPLLYFLH